MKNGKADTDPDDLCAVSMAVRPTIKQASYLPKSPRIEERERFDGMRLAPATLAAARRLAHFPLCRERLVAAGAVPIASARREKRNEIAAMAFQFSFEFEFDQGGANARNGAFGGANEIVNRNGRWP